MQDCPSKLSIATSAPAPTLACCGCPSAVGRHACYGCPSAVGHHDGPKSCRSAAHRDTALHVDPLDNGPGHRACHGHAPGSHAASPYRPLDNGPGHRACHGHAPLGGDLCPVTGHGCLHRRCAENSPTPRSLQISCRSSLSDLCSSLRQSIPCRR